MAPPDGINLRKYPQVTYKPPKGEPVQEPLYDTVRTHLRESTDTPPEFVARLTALLVYRGVIDVRDIQTLFPVNDLTKTLEIVPHKGGK